MPGPLSLTQPLKLCFLCNLLYVTKTWASYKGWAKLMSQYEMAILATLKSWSSFQSIELHDIYDEEHLFACWPTRRTKKLIIARRRQYFLISADPCVSRVGGRGGVGSPITPGRLITTEPLLLLSWNIRTHCHCQWNLETLLFHAAHGFSPKNNIPNLSESARRMAQGVKDNWNWCCMFVRRWHLRKHNHSPAFSTAGQRCWDTVGLLTAARIRGGRGGGREY